LTYTVKYVRINTETEQLRYACRKGLKQRPLRAVRS